MLSMGKFFLAAVCHEGSVEQYLKLGTIGHLFKGDAEAKLFALVDGHVKKHGVLPKPETVLLESGEELPKATDAATFYLDKMRDRLITDTLIGAANNANEKLKKGEGYDPQAAFKIMLDATMQLATLQHVNGLVDFREAFETIWPAYKAKQAGLDMGIPMGWPTLDTMTNGLRGGDVVSYVGRPAMGKTFQLLFSALHAWNDEKDDKGTLIREGGVLLFVSMEMTKELILERLTAMQFHLPLYPLKAGELTSKEVAKLLAGLKGLKGKQRPFHLIDGNLASTVSDVVMMARQLKPSAIYVDGAYLLQHPKERDRYRRVAENCDLIKRAAGDLGVPILATWQFNREASKKKAKGQEPGLDDIGYSDAIPQHSSIVLGLFEPESIATLKRRRVKVLKGRSGETGEFTMNWNFTTMDFSEVPDEVPLAELQYA